MAQLELLRRKLSQEYGGPASFEAALLRSNSSASAADLVCHRPTRMPGMGWAGPKLCAIHLEWRAMPRGGWHRKALVWLMRTGHVRASFNSTQLPVAMSAALLHRGTAKDSTLHNPVHNTPVAVHPTVGVQRIAVLFSAQEAPGGSGDGGRSLDEVCWLGIGSAPN